MVFIGGVHVFPEYREWLGAKSMVVNTSVNESEYPSLAIEWLLGGK